MSRQQHLSTVRYERITLGLWIKYSQKHPTKFRVIQTDKQNSQTTSFPFFSRMPKDGEYLAKLPLNLQGIIENGSSWTSWILLPIHTKQANVSITTRFNHLVQICLHERKLPSILSCK